MALKKEQEKEFARVLFVDQNLNIGAIAARVGATEKTVSKWIKEGEWKKFKTSLITTKAAQLTFLYNQLDWLNTSISMRDIQVATTKEADVIIKLNSAIRKMETETNIGNIVEVCRLLINTIAEENMQMAKDVTKYADLLIQTHLSKR